MDTKDTPKNIVQNLSLHKYFIHADKMKILFEQELRNIGSNEITFEGSLTNHYLYLDLWYGMLYVVIEGWIDLKLENFRINKQLEDPILNELKRFRNGIFHFQNNYFDKRFIDFISNKNSVKWIRETHDEFSKWFLQK